jgi:hypothetical protein
MKQLPFIIDKPLPETQDFQALKTAGLDFLKEHSGSEWTNFNASDPGVTILDQVCYALTELGYCNDFPIEDILTGPKGNIVTKDQFYLPQAILTTSPIIPDDYRKCLIDSNPAIQNAIVMAAPPTSPSKRYVYDVYLLLDGRLTPKQKRKSCKAAYYMLNKSRNLAETFNVPKPFKTFPFTVSGDIVINSQAPLEETLAAISNAIQQYVFPTAVQQGFEQLRQQGYDTSDIFDGPILSNGWFTHGGLGIKRPKLTATELMNVVSKVKGISQISELTMSVNGKVVDPILLAAPQMPLLDLAGSLSGGLKITYKGTLVPKNYKITVPKAPRGINTGNVYLDMVDQKDQLKLGAYRDIESYYSIQNTFPAIFSVGEDAATGSPTKYAVAQSRQLKAYLTLFDQVLANQFSQLAGVHRLFSFRNSLTADLFDEVSYYSNMTAGQKALPEYPAPYAYFSPTYYYRSLYDIPNIRPLLKDNDVKRFYTGQQTEEELDYDSWQSFKQDPYNAYIHGLSEFVEDEYTSLTRRNAMLDHLLARHGESPLEIDHMLSGSIYSGNDVKDLVIFKSLYLQNLGLLSYFRQKGYNMLAAQKIQPVQKRVPADFEHQILEGNNRDFIFDASKIDALERLTVTDFTNYSALELKMCLFFGLRITYLNFILSNYSKQHQSADIKHALWMITERKGSILIENGLMQNKFSYQVLLRRDPDEGPYLQVAELLNYNQAWEIVQVLTDNKEHEHDYENDGISVDDETHYTFDIAPGDQSLNQFFKRIPESPYYFTVKIDGKHEIEKFDEFPDFKSDLELVFPSFILPPDKEAFKGRIKYFLQQTLPVQHTCDAHFLGTAQLQSLISVYIYWHNNLIFKQKHHHGTA